MAPLTTPELDHLETLLAGMKPGPYRYLDEPSNDFILAQPNIGTIGIPIAEMPGNETVRREFIAIVALLNHAPALIRAARDHAETLRQNALLPRTGLGLAELLARHRIIQSDAVDDPEGYDGGVILDRCYNALAELLGHAPANDKTNP